MPGKPPFMLPLKSPALYYIQRLRDEAHRFAIGSPRQAPVHGHQAEPARRD
jgi:excinuclease ABC subunit C